MEQESATVLIGYDGSGDAENAIRRAGELLAARRAVVTYVWDSLAELFLQTDVDGLTGQLRAAADELDAEDAQEAEQIAARGAELAEEAGFDAKPAIARGRPRAWPTLLELADKHQAAAVVVGSRGLGRVKSALFGSVSSGVLDHAHLPVLIVPPPEESARPGPVLIGYDGSDDARAAVRAASRLLRRRETLIRTVWTSHEAVAPAAIAGVPVAVVTKAAEEIDRGAMESAQRTAEEGAKLAVSAGLEVQAESVKVAGNVWHTLIDTAEAHQVAAVVVGSRGRSAFGAALMGSVSRALVHHAPAPVLVVRPPASK